MEQKKFIQASEDNRNQDKSMILKNLQDTEKKWDKLNRLRSLWAKIGLSGDQGFNSDFKASPLGQSLSHIISGRVQPTANEYDVYGFHMLNLNNDGGTTWMSLRDIGSMVKKQQFDKASKSVITAMANDMVSRAGEMDPEDFNKEAVELSVKTNIIDKGNLRSLIHDQHIPGRIFFNDFKDMVSAIKYKSIGVESKDSLSKEDTNQIAANLIKNQPLLKQYLVKYFTNHMEKNWNIGSNSKNNNKDGIKNKNTTKGKIVDGKYVA